jgi:hypothetical protein
MRTLTETPKGHKDIVGWQTAQDKKGKVNRRQSCLKGKDQPLLLLLRPAAVTAAAAAAAAQPGM